MPIVKDLTVDLDKAAILESVQRLQGGPGRQQAWLDVVDQAVDEALALAQPAIAWDIFPVAAAEPSRLIIGDGHALESGVVASLFARVPAVVLMLFTIGPRLEERVAELGKAGDLPTAFVLDMVGSKALGSVGEKGRHTRASIPLNPGTSHWPMSGQRLLAELVGAKEIGVEALDSGVLRPFKTIAFAVALGDDVLTPAEGSSCDFCDRRDLCRG